MLTVNMDKYFRTDEKGRTIFIARRMKGYIVPDESRKADIVRALKGKDQAWLWSFLLYIACTTAAAFTVPVLPFPVPAVLLLAVCIPGIILIVRRANARLRKTVEGLEAAPENFLLREGLQSWSRFFSDIRSGFLWAIMIGVLCGAGGSVKLLVRFLSTGTFDIVMLAPLFYLALMSFALWIVIKELLRRRSPEAAVDREQQE